jgi:hypothetical protein
MCYLRVKEKGWSETTGLFDLSPPPLLHLGEGNGGNGCLSGWPYICTYTDACGQERMYTRRRSFDGNRKSLYSCTDRELQRFCEPAFDAGRFVLQPEKG